MQQKQAHHALLIYCQMIPSIRLCGHCQLTHLAQEGQLEYRAVQEARLHPSDLNWADVVLLGRLDSWYAERLVRRLHAAGKYLIYIIDDDLLNIPQGISSAVHYGQKEVRTHIFSLIAMSDAVLSPSPRLLMKYATQGRRAMLIEEPAIDPVPYKPHTPDNPVKIGFAGSIDRTGDIESLLGEALRRLKYIYGERIQLEFFGAVPSFAQELEAKCIPYQNEYDAYRQTLNSLDWDVGLAPMPETPFHACKHYNKFIEYAAAGTMGIFSATAPYTQLQAMGVPAVLCSNSVEAWFNALKYYVEHPQERETLRRRCTETACTQFSVTRVANGLMKELEVVPLIGSGQRVTKVWPVQAGKYGHAVLDKWRVHGVHLPLVAARKLTEKLRSVVR